MTTMTTDRANGLVLTALTVSGALVLVQAATRADVPAPRFFIGWAVAGLGLSVLAQAAPQLAGGVAVLMIVTSSIVYGGPAWKAIAGAVTSTTTGPTRAGTTA